MFCLFKNSHIHPSLNRYVMLVSWLGVVAWLYFAFVEKELVMKLFEGQAIMVDLLLGIPLVLMMAVVVYATIYWLFKLVIIYLLPQAVVPLNQEELTDSLEDQAQLEEQFGEEYWRHSDQQHDVHADESETDSELAAKKTQQACSESDSEKKADSQTSPESDKVTQTSVDRHNS